MPAATYSSTEEAAALTTLNTYRINSKVGPLTQHSQLDTSASNHLGHIATNNLVFNAEYMTNPSKGLHWEDASLPGFTGERPIDRVRFAGYTYDVSENGVVGFGLTGESCARILVEGSVYHRAAVLFSATDIGISFQAVGQGYFGCFMEIGLRGFDQLPAEATTYPYEGQTGAYSSFTPATESPNPAPDLSVTGLPVMISLYSQVTMPSTSTRFSASDIIVTQYSLVAQGSATPVAARVLAYPGVTGNGVTLTADGRLRDGHVFLLPTSALATNTTYTVTFTGTVKGVAANKTWSFTTGSV
jgi:hypothetical protein